MYFAAFALISCNNNQHTTAESKNSHTIDKKLSNTDHLNEKICYTNYSVKDTVKLELERNENRINGSLRIKLLGKNENKGTFSGVLRGDTLVADYTFMSEGVTSVRQIAFLKRNNTLVEGYGDVKNGF